jgi:hypothetical protein
VLERKDGEEGGAVEGEGGQVEWWQEARQCVLRSKQVAAQARALDEGGQRKGSRERGGGGSGTAERVLAGGSVRVLGRDKEEERARFQVDSFLRCLSLSVCIN